MSIEMSVDCRWFYSCRWECNRVNSWSHMWHRGNCYMDTKTRHSSVAQVEGNNNWAVERVLLMQQALHSTRVTRKVLLKGSWLEYVCVHLMTILRHTNLFLKQREANHLSQHWLDNERCQCDPSNECNINHLTKVRDTFYSLSLNAARHIIELNIGFSPALFMSNLQE